jgi:hypothetical protein
MVWNPELRRQVGIQRKVYFNLQVHEFTAPTELVMDLELHDKFPDVRVQDMKKAEILTLRIS